ncbi:MAG: DUF4352 domain-containing protein [Bacilli bacterium]|nr:DUF4352 domain-containing protein [Bacilli bacterium]
MILKKPYAFLIKNFKKIHILLTILIIYATYRISNILQFFNNYVDNGTFSYNGTESLVSNYIDIYLYLTILVIIVITSIIYILMRAKQKPKLFYICIIIFNFLILVYLYQVSNNLNIMEISTISPQKARVLRDISLIAIVAQYSLLVLVLIRAVGFDIKKFNFGEDLEQLQIEATDDEEFELTVGIDTRSLVRKLRRQKRELKYFFIENIFIISLILTISISIIGISLYLNYQVYNKVYNENESVKIASASLKVLDSYYSKKDYQGNIIAPVGKTYLITKISITNQDDVDLNLKLNNFNIITGNGIYNNIKEKYSYFFDIGKGYNEELVKPLSTNSYILIFLIDESEIDNDPTLRYTQSAYFKSNKLEAKYKKIDLNPESLDQKTTVGTAVLGEKLWLGESLIKDSSLLIKGIEIIDKVEYTATSCILDDCSTYNKSIIADDYDMKTKTLLKIDATIKLDKNISYTGIDNLGELINAFGKVKYTINHKAYYATLTNKTPDDYTDVFTFVQLTSKIKDGKEVKLIITVRNKEYIFSIKD